MLKKTFFLDRDGVINEDNGYVTRVSQFIFTRGACEAIRYLNMQNFLVIIITNQAAIGKNLMSEDDLFKIHKYMKDYLLNSCQAHIDDIFYSPYFKDSKIPLYTQNQNDRKPDNGLIIKAIEKWNVDIKNSFFIGDNTTDKIAAEKSNIKFYFKENNSLYDQIRNIIENI